jgi:hypothetical protein
LSCAHLSDGLGGDLSLQRQLLRADVKLLPELSQLVGVMLEDEVMLGPQILSAISVILRC